MFSPYSPIKTSTITKPNYTIARDEKAFWSVENWSELFNDNKEAFKPILLHIYGTTAMGKLLSFIHLYNYTFIHSPHVSLLEK